MLAILMTEWNKCKNEVRCRDDTVPKTVETRRHCEEHACNNLPQPLKGACERRSQQEVDGCNVLAL